MSNTFYLIDASGYIFRAYHALPPFTTSLGVPTGAVYGYASMILKLLNDHRPKYLAAAFDAARETFRTAEYADYKANRPDLPIDLAPQFPLIYEVTRAFRIPLLIEKGVEADDLIATMAKRAKEAGFLVQILSADKDLMQLVDDKVSLFDPIRAKPYGPKEVLDKFGVGPEKIPDFLGLVGDTSDNLPGVPGVGPKTAADLLKTFGDLETVLASVDKIKGQKRKEMLITHAENARLSKRLATLRFDVPIPHTLDEFIFPGIDAGAAKALFHRLEFSRLLSQVAAPSPIDRSRYRAILDKEALLAVIEDIKKAGEYAVDLETTALDPHRAEIVGVSLSCKEAEAVYIPVAHHYLGVPKQLPREEVLGLLKPILEDPNLKLYGQHSKYERVIFARYGIRMAPVACDTMLASYVLKPDESHSLASISLRQLGHQMITYEEVTGKGKKQINFSEVDVPRATEYSAEDADVTFRLAKLLPPKVEALGLTKLLVEVEQPLSALLGKIESNGVRVDVEHLRRMSNKLGAQMALLEKRCHELAGGEFNVSSPKQLQEILFERLKLPVLKRTKTGPSTDSSVLAEIDHPLAKAILEHRQLAKLKGTYLDTLPGLVHPKTGRIHTSFNQAVAATGRLSTSEPSLQNIPVRTEVGREIREAFIAAPGNTIAALDYSQIELRLLAHFSGDPAFVAAFRAGEDIHRRTAAQLFSKDPKDVTSDERRISKTINFGVIYGMGAFRLKQELGISQSEAQDYIDRFFLRYAGIRKFFDEVLEKARKEGEIRTILGRRRGFTDLMSPNQQVRAINERMAMNSPIQGCLQRTARVLTDSGYIAIGELYKTGSANRKVWTGSSWADFQVLDMGSCQLAELELQDGTIIPCDTRHKLLVVTDTGYDWKEFSALQVGDRIATPMARAFEFDPPPLPPLTIGARSTLRPAFPSGAEIELWFWIGYYYGDGWKEDTRGDLVYTFGSHEMESLDRCGAFWARWGLNPRIVSSTHTPAQKTSTRYRLDLKSVDLVRWLSRLGVTPSNAHQKRLPSRIFSERLEHRLSFIKGFLAADGYRPSPQKTNPNLHLCQRPLLEDVKLLLRTMGVESVLRGPYAHRDTTSYRLDIFNRMLEEILGESEGIWPRIGRMETPRFLIEELLEKYGTAPKKEFPTASSYTLFRRLCSGGTLSLYTFDRLLRLMGWELEQPIYATRDLVAKRELERVENTFTLSVNHPLHRFDAEGVITKNSAADVIKLAMLKVDEAMVKEALSSMMILQVHDELLFDVPEAELGVLCALAKREMEGVGQTLGLKVPLLVEVGHGANWAEAH